MFLSNEHVVSDMLPEGRSATAARATLVSIAAGTLLLGYVKFASDFSWGSLAGASFVLAGAAAAARTRLVVRAPGSEAVRVGGTVAGVPCLVLAVQFVAGAVTRRAATILGATGETGAKMSLLAIETTQSGLLVAGILAAVTVPPAMVGAGIARTVVGSRPTAVEPPTPEPDDWPLARGTRIGLVAGVGVFLALIADLFVEATVGGGPVTLAVTPVLEALFGTSGTSEVSTPTLGVVAGLLPAVTVGVMTGLWYRARTAAPTLGDRLRILLLLTAVPVGFAVGALVLWLVAWVFEGGIMAVIIGLPLFLLGLLLVLAAVPITVGLPAVLGYGLGELLGTMYLRASTGSA